MAAQRADTPTEKRLLALTRGLVAAGADRTAAAAEAIAALLALSASDVLATADAAAVWATLADLQGQPARVLEAAHAALQIHDRVCPAAPGGDYRSLWRMRMMSSRRAEGRGESSAAHEHALAAAELARSAADPLRQAWALGQAADISGSHGDPVAAQRLLGQAQRLVRLEGSSLALSRLRLFETRSLVRNQDTAGAVRAAKSGRQLARVAGSPRLMASHLANRSDLAMRAGRPRDAMAAVQQALPIMRRHGEQRAERVLMHNAALLLVDIDDFKHVNDGCGHGHAAGDAVLVEVARRLVTAVRGIDPVVRWGGEEFLICMRGAGGPQALALTEGELQAVAGKPVPLPRAGAGPAAGTLRVTVSLGYGSFPLPPARLPLTLERATNLADRALYTAKGLGRNRAVGITAARADEGGALRGIEADFDQAWHEGRLTLQPTPGPAAAGPLPSVARVSEPA